MKPRTILMIGVMGLKMFVLPKLAAAGQIPSKLSRWGIDNLKFLEAFSPTVYEDQTGIKHIGYGHRILPGEAFTTITEAQAQALMFRDLQPVYQAITANVTVGLSQNQFDALVLFVYNVGISAFIDSTMLKLINAGDFEGAAAQFPLWNKVTINNSAFPSAGLTKRRQIEQNIFVA